MNTDTTDQTKTKTITADREVDHDRYARAIDASKRARWKIEDVLRGRTFDLSYKMMPDALSLAERVPFLDEKALLFFSQIQGRTYANVFGLVERFVNALALGVGQRHLFGDQVAMEAMVRFSDEELKHQELFRRLEKLAAAEMPDGYRFDHDANAVAGAVLSKSTWAVLALTCVIELVTQAHYKAAIRSQDGLSPLFQDVFRAHWMEESQHAVLDELEWLAEDRKISADARDKAVSDLIDLVGAVDGLMDAQAKADAAYFFQHAGPFTDAQRDQIAQTFVAAYRWQHIVSGVELTRFPQILRRLVDDDQWQRVLDALAPLMSSRSTLLASSVP